MIPHDVVLRPVDPPGTPAYLALTGPAAQTGGTARWELVDRPRRKGVPEYVGTDPWRLTLPCLLDGIDASPPRDRFRGRNLRRPLPARDWTVEPMVDRLTRLAQLVPGKPRPAVVTVTGPVPLTGLRWVVESLEWGEHLRTSHRHPGRTRQLVEVTLLEHTTPDVFLGPAQAAQERKAATPGAAAPAPGGAVRTYTVRAGDTLSRIAARELGSASRWPELAKLNALRDPNLVRVGQVLRLP